MWKQIGHRQVTRGSEIRHGAFRQRPTASITAFPFFALPEFPSPGDLNETGERCDRAADGDQAFRTACRCEFRPFFPVLNFS